MVPFTAFNYCEFLQFVLRIEDTQKLQSLEKFEKYIMGFISKKNLTINLLFSINLHILILHSTTNWKKYFEESRQKTVSIINELSSKIQKYDPNGILIIIGDHGPSLLKSSKEVKFHQNIMRTYNNDEKLAMLWIDFIQLELYDNSSVCEEYTSKLKQKLYHQ